MSAPRHKRQHCPHTRWHNDSTASRYDSAAAIDVANASIASPPEVYAVLGQHPYMAALSPQLGAVQP
eukprot:2084846-Rhodomonas_salina.1